MSEKFEQEAIGAYGYDSKHNLTENGILMVTITLSEYRDLLIEKARSDQFKRDMENWELRKEIDTLKAKIVKMASGEGEEE